MTSKGKWALGIGLVILVIAVKKLWSGGAGVHMAFAAAPPATVNFDTGYSVVVKVTNKSKKSGTPVVYKFRLAFETWINYGEAGFTINTSTFDLTLPADGQDDAGITMSISSYYAPYANNAGWLIVKLLTTDESQILDQIRADFTITQAPLIPGGSISWV